MWQEFNERPTSSAGSTGIRIGVIGPEEMMEAMAYCLKSFPSFHHVIRSYRSEDEAPAIARALAEETEVLLFTGPIPYRLAKERFHFKVPVLFVPLTGSGLYSSLFRLERKGKLSALSVDTLTKPILHAAMRELGAPEIKLSFLDDAAQYPSREEIIAFHREQFRAGHTQCALTALRSAAEQLNQEGIPAEWIKPANQDIIVTLERALLSTEWRRNKEAQIVMGIIHVDNFGRLAELQASEHEVQRLKLDIHHMVLNFVEHLDGHLTQQSSNEYLFVTTRGIFERETGGYKSIPLAKKARQSYGLQLSIGVGFGLSAGEAGKHARNSLRLAKDGGGGICFIVREDESIIGPLEMTEPHEFDLSLIDTSLMKQVESAGMTPSYLSKLIAYTTRNGKIDYYAQELASVLGVTVRSIHRLLITWLDANLVEIVGEDKSSSRGRPRQLYRLSFLEGLIR